MPPASISPLPSRTQFFWGMLLPGRSHHLTSMVLSNLLWPLRFEYLPRGLPFKMTALLVQCLLGFLLPVAFNQYMLGASKAPGKAGRRLRYSRFQLGWISGGVKVHKVSPSQLGGPEGLQELRLCLAARLGVDQASLRLRIWEGCTTIAYSSMSAGGSSSRGRPIQLSPRDVIDCLPPEAARSAGQVAVAGPYRLSGPQGSHPDEEMKGGEDEEVDQPRMSLHVLDQPYALRDQDTEVNVIVSGVPAALLKGYGRPRVWTSFGELMGVTDYSANWSPAGPGAVRLCLYFPASALLQEGVLTIQLELAVDDGQGQAEWLLSNELLLPIVSKGELLRI